MEVCRKSSWLLLLLGITFLATTLQGRFWSPNFKSAPLRAAEFEIIPRSSAWDNYFVSQWYAPAVVLIKFASDNRGFGRCYIILCVWHFKVTNANAVSKSQCKQNRRSFVYACPKNKIAFLVTTVRGVVLQNLKNSVGL